MSTAFSNETYFDLHINGLGYLNRIREVKPKKGDAFLACDIVALNGPTDNPEYRRFDVKVSGEEAQGLIRRCAKAVELDRKVLIGFRLGDPWVDTFTYTKGINVGQPGISLKARLLLLHWIKIDGICVHKREPLIKDVEKLDDASPASETQSEPIGEAHVAR
ncbi:DUF3577 domain-containing protein [Pseudomonas granadensis]|uniref:DUF3577 domain-containing protein n=1 Tax=Pseudomonas granadensis TaxID=1421430 RepID=A0ABX7G9C1_9PSED|nr:STY4534 family ICE replication protein [Pseudomonas granadensis]QRK81811.1 DUF3577 domain-containing protein [Pseudomonas granadensis]